MPHEAVDLGQLDPGLRGRLIEEAELDPVRDLGEQGKVRSRPIPRSAERIGGSRPQLHPQTLIRAPGLLTDAGCRAAPGRPAAGRTAPPGPEAARGRVELRDAQNASATAAPHENRVSSDPCRTTVSRRPAQPPGQVVVPAAGPAAAAAASSRQQPGGGRVQPPVGPGRRVDLGQHAVSGLRRPAQRAEDVQGRDVARALPDRVQRRVPVQPGQARLLHIAVPAQALQCLGGDHRDALADPESQAAACPAPAARNSCLRAVAARRRRVGRPGQPQRQARSRPPTPGSGRRSPRSSPGGRSPARRTRGGPRRSAPP